MKLPKLPLLASVMSSMFAAPTYAVPYPSGVTLAEAQEITLNNGAEVTSIDPAKQAAEPAFNHFRVHCRTTINARTRA